MTIRCRPHCILAFLALFSVSTTAQPAPLRWPLDLKPALSSTFGETRATAFHAGVDLKTWGKKKADETWNNTAKISLDSLVKVGYVKQDDKCLMKLGKKDVWYYKSIKCNKPSGNYIVEIKINEANPRKVEMTQKRENLGIAGKTALDVTNFLIEQLKSDDKEESEENEREGEQ